MNSESEYGRVGKENRRKRQIADQSREFSHPFKLLPHAPDKKQSEKRLHLAVRKAMKKRR